MAVARITLLVQGGTATTTLIEAARTHSRPIPPLLREDPPVPAVLALGAGHRPSPASTHANAAACRVLDALSR